MYIETPFNYTGSKLKLLDQIIPLLDTSKSTFVDLFTGGGSVYTNVVDKYNKIIVNDIISDLIGIHKKLIESDQIITDVQNLVVNKDDKDGYIKLREDYNSNKTPEKLWALMLCCTNNMMRFNNNFEFNQTFGQRTFNSRTGPKIEKFVNHIRPHRNKIIFNSKPFYQMPIIISGTYYIDPPYGYVEDENGEIGNKQISEAGYNAFYKKEDDIKLYEYCHKINNVGATFMMSGLLEHDGKKSWILNKLIKDGFSYRELVMDYNKVSRKGDKISKEIIVFNYKIDDNDITQIRTQNGELLPLNTYCYNIKNDVYLGSKKVATYNKIEQVNIVLKQMKTAQNKKFKIYTLPENNFEIETKWFS